MWGLFKVGLELFVAEGPAFLKFITETARVDYFLDLKFHDIPATVARAQAQIKHGPRLTTLHVDQGPKMLKAMVASLKDGAKVLGVTVLTHLGPDDLEALGIAPRYAHDPSQLVLLRARLAKEAGCDGVVCAGTEARAVKAACGPEFLVVCPGIRPAWAAVPGDDQKRVMTPYEAIKAGADYIVVGRPSGWRRTRWMRPGKWWRRLSKGCGTGPDCHKRQPGPRAGKRSASRL